MHAITATLFIATVEYWQLPAAVLARNKLSAVFVHLRGYWTLEINYRPELLFTHFYTARVKAFYSITTKPLINTYKDNVYNISVCKIARS